MFLCGTSTDCYGYFKFGDPIYRSYLVDLISIYTQLHGRNTLMVLTRVSGRANWFEVCVAVWIGLTID